MDVQEKLLKAKSIRGTYENVINSLDGRKHVIKPDEWPYSVHGVITGFFKDETFRGTGVLIGPNVVLTAGHSLFYYSKGVYASLESIRFRPEIKGDFSPLGEAEAEKYFVSPDYVIDEKEDYGIIILKEPI